MAIDNDTEPASGVAVPDSERPQKSPTLYPEKDFRSPHSYALPFVPVDHKGGQDICGPYEPVAEWPEPVVEGWRIAGGASVHVDTSDRIIVASHFGRIEERTTPLTWGRNLFTMDGSPYQRSATEKNSTAANFVTVYNAAGKVTEAWTWNDHLFGKVNRVFVEPGDADRHVWVCDSFKQKIYKFTSDGKELVMSIGESEAGSSKDNPWKAQDIAWLPNGDFYTVGLGRIDKFSKDGKHISAITKRGSGPGEFLDLHGLILDNDRDRIIVSDRGNSRIQVLDRDFNYIDEWRNILAPYALRMTTDGFVWVGDGYTQKFLKYSPEGELLLSWGTFGIAPGCTWGIHYFDVDDDGNLYLIENYGDRAQKYRRRDDVDPSDPRLIGPLHRY